MKIVVTGAAGLIGRHIGLYLGSLERYRDHVVHLDRAAFADDKVALDALRGARAVIHCAGVNRGEPAEVEEGNRRIAERLVSLLKNSGGTPHVFYTNSTHKASDTPYGRGKSEAHRLFAGWAENGDARYTELVLPHVFGEGGRPFYNSAIHSFCHQLANGEEMSVNGAGRLELLHAHDIATAVVDALERGQTGSLRLEGVPMSVATAAGKLTDLYSSYDSGIIPDLRSGLDLQLFNTLRSFLYPAFYPRELTLHTDPRGSLFEAVKNHNGGQAFLSTTRPGITRGDHYHFNKVERFLVVQGEAVIRIRAVGDDRVREFHVSGERPAFVDMPTLHTHSITNTGDQELLTMFWSNEIFDPEHPDTYYLPVLEGGADA